ncbi:MAG: DUF4258 domain-containing protein [Gloeobacteraceae cyanobacterium ES-bin-316]|nr:DUF4258 domain-containing protein [Ferruginibacter sp.]
MNKKYHYFLYLIAAILLFYWVKTNQSGKLATKNNTAQKNEVNQQLLDRSVTELVYSKHARCRMDCRQIDESEVEEILREGILNENKIQKSKKGFSYPLEGITHDGQRVRIVYAPQGEKLVVVTVIDLEKDVACECE